MNRLNINQEDRDELQHIINEATTVLGNNPHIAAAYLLGSATTGQLRDDSDIDIALLPTEKQTVSVKDRLELAGLLESILGRTIDVGIINSDNLVYASEAILKGKRFLTSQKNYTEATETRLLGCYLVFKQDRKEVEEVYRAA